MISTAEFSSDDLYRYDLLRRWDAKKKLCVFILLNPSTADAMKNDPTVSRCQRRAQMWGYGGLRVLNIFAYRSTDPMKLYTLRDPVGFYNDGKIMLVCRKRETGLVVCGWGMHGAHLDRGVQVLDLIRRNGRIPHALKINSDGSPQHPLYLSYKLKPEPMR